MPFRCEWKVRGKVLYGHVGPELTIEEVGAMTRAATELIVSDGTPPIYFIVDMSDLHRPPLSLTQLRRTAGEEVADRIGCYIIIVTNPIYGFVGAAFVKLLRRPVRIVSAYSEAIDTLNDFEPGLAARVTP